MAKIQHKRSLVLDGGVAKEPTAAQTEYGELCVNYSTTDPALFIKDDTQGIRRVGGDLSLYQKIEDLPEVDLEYVSNGDSDATLTNTGGDDATIPVATNSTAGLFTGAEKQKLAGIEPGGEVNPEAGRALTYDVGTDPDTLNVDIATVSALGVVKVGTGLDIAADGTLTVDNTESIQYGRALSLDSSTSPSTLDVDIATASALGVVKVGDGIDVDADGEISVSFPPSETYIGETPPASPAEGTLWWADTDVNDGGGRLYVWSGDEWVDVSLPGAGFSGDYNDLDNKPDLDVYLSSVTDDTAAGAITFEKLTTHEEGVSVTGGDVVQSSPGGSFIASNSGVNLGAVSYTGTQQRHNGRYVSYASYTSANFGPLYEFYQTNTTVSRQFAVGLAGGSPYVFTDGNNPVNDPSTIPLGISPPVNFDQLTGHAGGVSVTGGGVTTVGTDAGANWGGNQAAKFLARGASTATTAQGFAATQLTSGTDNTVTNFLAQGADNQVGNTNYGFKSNLSATGTNGAVATNYNFFAEGSAPNYFAGDTQIGGVSGGDPLQGGNLCTFTPGGSFTQNISKSTNSAGGACLSLNRNGSDRGRFITFLYNNTVTDAIEMDGLGGVMFGTTSDYRVKENIVDLPSAVDQVKALHPVSFTYIWAPGKARPGFIAHELQEQVSSAVVGTKDATEAIGTLADYDGTVLQTAVVEPEAADLEYTEEVETDGVATMVTRTKTWTPTGTKPIYQGVDQTKLIPLLTKALQEALTEIDNLKSRITTLESN
jgi:hypothetical protein